MSRLRFLCLAFIVVLVAGCSSPGRVLAKYFERVASIEGQLSQLQSEFMKSETIGRDQRKEIYNSIAQRARDSRQELLKIQTPPPAEKYRDALAGALDDFANFSEVASDSLGQSDKEEQAKLAQKREELKTSFKGGTDDA